MVNVIDVELDAFVHALDGCRLAAIARNLRPAGDAGFYAMARGIFVDDRLQRLAAALGPQVASLAPHRMRPRAYQGHIAAQDIEQLGQFIKAPATNEGTHAGHAWIAPGRLLQRLVRCPRRPHAAKLIDGERSIVETEPLLPEQDGATAR